MGLLKELRDSALAVAMGPASLFLTMTKYYCKHCGTAVKEGMTGNRTVQKLRRHLYEECPKYRPT